IGLKYPLHIQEEKSLVLAKWTSQREAILIPRMIRSRQARLVAEKVVGVERSALSKPPAAAMKAVGAALQRHVDHGSAIAAELRRTAVVLYLELLYRLNRGLVVDVRISALALFRRADQCTVEPHLGSRIPLPVRNEICAGGIIIGRTGTRSFAHTGIEKNQPKKVAIQQRDFLDVLAGNICP